MSAFPSVQPSGFNQEAGEIEETCAALYDPDPASPSSDNTRLCSRCEGLPLWISERVKESYDGISCEPYTGPFRGAEIHQNSSRCAFCELVTRSLQIQLWDACSETVTLHGPEIIRDMERERTISGLILWVLYKDEWWYYIQFPICCE